MYLTVVFEQVPEGFIKELPGANRQGSTLEGVRRKAVELVLEANRAFIEESLKGRNSIREIFYTTA